MKVLELKSGLKIGEPLKVLEAKFEAWPWAQYDGVSPKNLNRISEEDIEVAYQLGSRSSRAEYRTLLRRQGATLASCLRRIEPERSIVDPITPLRPVLVQLFDAALSVRGIKLAGATKLLSRLRPAFVPVIDSIVENYYWYATSIRDTHRFRQLEAEESWGRYVFILLDLIRDDVRGSLPSIRAIQREAGARGHLWAAASEVRLVESAIWYYYARGNAPPRRGKG